ncbi:MAG: type II secretion system F family protein [Acidimicrobiia bacterium]
MEFNYRARTFDGGIQEGVIQAATADEAMRILVRDKLIPESVKPAVENQSFRLTRRPRPKSVVLFARQFATLVDAAVPLVESLEVAAELSEDRNLRRALEQVSADVQSGLSLADAMRRHPKAFTNIFVNMVEAGEQAGVLEKVLDRLAVYLEKSQLLASRIKGAMIYPCIILAVAIISAGVMLTFVVPSFEELFAAGGLELPYPTQVMINLSDFLRARWLSLLVATILTILVLRHAYGTKTGRAIADALALKLPVLGDLIRKSAVARFSQSMSSLLSAGLNFIDAFVASAGTTGNTVIQNAILRSRPAIEGGGGIAEALAASGQMPNLVHKMVSVGEATGRLDDMFDKVAGFYEDEIETATEALVKALEPMFILVVGVILGGMVVALYLPIFEAMTSLA